MKDKKLMIFALIVAGLIAYYLEFHSGIKSSSKDSGIEYELMK